jgi:4a-hydroxytetrahydrobiopterin dehydratase
MELKEKRCKPCEGGVPPLKPEEIRKYKSRLKNDWQIIENKKIHFSYKFRNFKEALDFANKVGQIAEEEQHHPDLHIYYGKLGIDLSTHAIKGLSENDFIIASKIEAL